MTGTIHPYRPNYPFISGIDIALWDVAGKLLDLPIYRLMGGPLRDAVEMYSHGDTLKDMGSPESCLAWAEWNRAQPEGFKTFKIEPLQALPGEHVGPEISTAQLGKVARGFANVREAVGERPRHRRPLPQPVRRPQRHCGVQSHRGQYTLPGSKTR